MSEPDPYVRSLGWFGIGTIVTAIAVEVTAFTAVEAGYVLGIATIVVLGIYGAIKSTQPPEDSLT